MVGEGVVEGGKDNEGVVGRQSRTRQKLLSIEPLFYSRGSSFRELNSITQTTFAFN